MNLLIVLLSEFMIFMLLMRVILASEFEVIIGGDDFDHIFGNGGGLHDLAVMTLFFCKE